MLKPNPDTDVIDDEAQPVQITDTGELKPPPENPEAKATAAEKDKPAITPAELRRLNKRLEDLEGQVQQANDAAMHWHDQYKAASGPNGKVKPAPAADDDPEPDEVDLIDVITTKGTKGLLNVMRKAGFMTQEEFETRAEAKIRGHQKEQTIRDRYPDLADQESDMFRETARHYKALEAEGITGPARVELAAERAELEMRRKGTWKDPEEREERLNRARAQAGGNGRGTKSGDVEDKSLTSTQKRIADIFEISEDAYQKRATDGSVRLAGMRR